MHVYIYIYLCTVYVYILGSEPRVLSSAETQSHCGICLVAGCLVGPGRQSTDLDAARGPKWWLGVAGVEPALFGKDGNVGPDLGNVRILGDVRIPQMSGAKEGGNAQCEAPCSLPCCSQMFPDLEASGHRR